MCGVRVDLYDGSGGDDNLIVDLGQGEATARVQNSSPASTDEVMSSTLPTVLFNGINNFTLTETLANQRRPHLSSIRLEDPQIIRLRAKMQIRCHRRQWRT